MKEIIKEIAEYNEKVSESIAKTKELIKLKKKVNKINKKADTCNDYFINQIGDYRDEGEYISRMVDAIELLTSGKVCEANINPFNGDIDVEIKGIKLSHLKKVSHNFDCEDGIIRETVSVELDDTVDKSV